MKISVVVSAFNEEKNLKDCLKSVKWADEIIVVDNESTDKTVKIAKRFTDKIFSRPNNPLMLNLNKNYGFSKAKGDWIISLDPDERISDKLREEIKVAVTSVDDNIDGFLIPRKNIIFGKWIKHGLWYPDHQLRLFRKGKGQFPGKHNHELLEVKGETKKLEEHIVHYNYTSVNNYINKIIYYYSDNEVENYIKSGKQIHWYDAIRMPISDFLLNFFARKGYKDGLHGLILALLQAFYTLIVFTKIWEKQGYWEYNSDDFSKDVKTELISKGKEFIYWINRVKIEEAPKYKKLFLKLINRLFS